MVKKVYLSVPLVANRDLQTAGVLVDAVKAAGHEVVSPWVLQGNPNDDLNEIGVFERDTGAVKRCDILIAEVSVPSHGVGMELMLAHLLGKRIICICREGTKLSWMIKGMSDIYLIKYDGMQDLREKLLTRLKQL